MTPVTQEFRPIGIKPPAALGPDDLLLHGFKGTEGLSVPFRFELEMVSQKSSISFDSIVGKDVTVRVELSDGSQRFFNGLISEFGQSGQDYSYNLTRYSAVMVPWLHFLDYSSGCRILQNKKVPDILQEVFSSGNWPCEMGQLVGDFPTREYCVQYQETDLHFVSRLMEEEGIYYYFKHEDGKHTLMLANDPGAHQPCPKQATALWQTTQNGWRQDDVVLGWQVSHRFRAGRYTVVDYNFETPKTDLSSLADASPSNTDYGKFAFPGGYVDDSTGKRIAKLRLEAEQAQTVGISGESVCRSFAPGYVFQLQGHYRDDQNAAWLLTEVTHNILQSGEFRSDMSTGDVGYSNKFKCIPASLQYRAPLTHPKNRIGGAQTGFVVGTSGEIDPDQYGRVRVQFHWDLARKNNQESSCWIRVAQTLAGKGWGAFTLPRIGQEVVVEFLEGDPDRPLITGSVYNAAQTTPYDLPGNKTRSTFKTNSSEGGGGCNELRFEDKKGEEQVFLQAERNLDVNVKNDMFTTVAGEQHIHVTKEQFLQVDADQHATIKGDRNEEVDGTVSLKAGQDVQEKVGNNYGLDAGMQVYLKAGMTAVIEAGMSLTLKVGGNFVNIGPAGVSISGTMVLINSGGAADSGAGVSPETPKAPRDADKNTPGKSDAPALPPIAPKAPPPPVPAIFGPAAQALINGSHTGSHFCEVCNAWVPD